MNKETTPFDHTLYVWKVENLVAGILRYANSSHFGITNRFIIDHFFITNAPDGVYDGASFKEVWQFYDARGWSTSLKHVRDGFKSFNDYADHMKYNYGKNTRRFLDHTGTPKQQGEQFAKMAKDKPVCAENCECKTGEDCYGEAGMNLVEAVEKEQFLPRSVNDHDYREDFVHENGMYENICPECGAYFFGHKCRVFCKVCDRKGREGAAKLQQAKNELSSNPCQLEQADPSSEGKETIEQAARIEAEKRWTPQPGKHWIRTLRNERVDKFVLGAKWQSQHTDTVIAELKEENEEYRQRDLAHAIDVDYLQQEIAEYKERIQAQADKAANIKNLIEGFMDSRTVLNETKGTLQLVLNHVEALVNLSRHLEAENERLKK